MSSVLKWVMVVVAALMFSFLQPAQAGEVSDWIVKSTRNKVSTAHAKRIESAVYRNAFEKELDPKLVFQMIGVESSYRWWAHSDKDAIGLMQVVYRYHKALVAKTIGKKQRLYQIEDNIAVGTEILRSFIVRYGSEDAGIRAYYGDHKRNTYLNKVRTYPVPTELVLPEPANEPSLDNLADKITPEFLPVPDFYASISSK
jgi:soluble lytic murein transglycosylase-like protein